MEIKQISQQIHQNNMEHGFWEGGKEGKNVGEILMLVVSELGEALEADRKNKHSICGTLTEHIKLGGDFILGFEEYVKDTFEDEIADSVIRLFDIAEGFGIDLEWHIEQKIKYNKTRPFKHNKAY